MSFTGDCDEDIKQASDAIDLCFIASDDEKPTLKHRGPRGKRHKRGEGGDYGTTNDVSEKLIQFQNSPHYLRIPASSVAALCGLHPFQDLPQLLYDFVYQSYLGQMLLHRDAQVLGLTVVDAKSHEQETMMSLASAASKETKDLVKQVLEVSEGKRKLQSVDEVQSIQKQIKAQAVKAQETGKLSKKQVESLVEASRGHVSTGFGTCHEDEALDVYEKRTGCRIRERNEALMEWRFRRVYDVNSELGVTAIPMGDSKRRGWGQLNAQSLQEKDKGGEPVKTEEAGDGTDAKPIEINDNSQDEESHNKQEAETKTVKEKPFFRIVGAVDGIRDELYMDSSKPTPSKPSDWVPSDKATTIDPSGNKNNAEQDGYNFSDDEEEEWSLRPIIVECKHRMNEAKVPPSLYDQIQTCLYCHMYKVQEADLIQVVRRKGKKSEEKENTELKNNEDKNSEGKTKDTSRNQEDMKITVTRVSLNDPIHNHNHHWNATLLPRISSFVDAVYNVRQDDGKRYRLLMALVQSQQEHTHAQAEEESWKLLWQECPWLRHCDTAFGRRKRF